MAFTAAVSAAAKTSALPRRLRHSTPIAMASSVSMLPRHPRLHASSSSLASTATPVPYLCRRHRRGRSSSNKVYAFLRGWSAVSVNGIQPANSEESVYLIRLDLSNAPILLSKYRTPWQYVLTRVPSAEEEKKRSPAYMAICSPPRSGNYIELLVKSVPNTTSELLCNLKNGDVVELGPCMGQGFSNPIENLNPPEEMEARGIKRTNEIVVVRRRNLGEQVV